MDKTGRICALVTGGRRRAAAGFFILCLFANSVFASAQDIPVTLNEAIKNTVSYLETRIPGDSKVVVLNVASKDGNLSDYIINSITERIVNDNFFTAVDRHNLNLIQGEVAFQMSGEVSDETAQTIGQKLGAESIISGSIVSFGDLYRLQIRAIEVKTAKIQGIQSFLIAQDAILQAITGKRYGLGSSFTAKEDDWKNKWLYAAFRAGPGIHFYNTGGGAYSATKSGNGISFDGAVQITAQLLDFIALQTEVIFTADSFAVLARENVTDSAGNILHGYDTVITITSNSILAPILLNFSYCPGVYLLSLSGGIFFGLPFNAVMTGSSGDESYTGALSATMGYAVAVNAGLKIGPGLLFVDVRYMGDLTSATFDSSDVILSAYKRNILEVSLGYRFGFFSK
jgi:TolB-like protein